MAQFTTFKCDSCGGETTIADHMVSITIKWLPVGDPRHWQGIERSKDLCWACCDRLGVATPARVQEQPELKKATTFEDLVRALVEEAIEERGVS